MRGPIHKTQLYYGTTSISGKVVHAAEQDGVMMAWYEEDGFHREYVLLATGQVPPDTAEHVCTLLSDDQTLVWHLYRAYA
jgi:hypothetical protein